MKNTALDTEYYVFDSDWLISTNPQHPDLAWGDYDDTAFTKENRIKKSELPSPLAVVFNEPLPRTYEMVDIHKLGTQFACTAPVKDVLEQAYGIDFFAIDAIEAPKGIKIEGYFATHIWNNIDALDRENTTGIERHGPSSRRIITSVKRFSLDGKILKAIPLENRLLFRLPEPNNTFIIHKSLAEQILQAGFTGFMLKRVDEWRRLFEW